MADSAVDITAGTGTSIDTRTEGTNGNHRQVVVLGDPAANAGVAGVDATYGLAVDVKRVFGQALHDAFIDGGPVRIGARAVSANYTPVATGDQADMISTLVGALITKPYTIPEGEWTYAAALGGIDGTTTAVTINAAAAAGLRNYITSMQIAHATLANSTELAIRDGAGGTVLFRTLLHTTALPTMSITFPVPIKGTAATLLEVVTLTSAAGDVLVNFQGYIAP